MRQRCASRVDVWDKSELQSSLTFLVMTFRKLSMVLVTPLSALLLPL